MYYEGATGHRINIRIRPNLRGMYQKVEGTGAGADWINRVQW